MQQRDNSKTPTGQSARDLHTSMQITQYFCLQNRQNRTINIMLVTFATIDHDCKDVLATAAARCTSR